MAGGRENTVAAGSRVLEPPDAPAGSSSRVRRFGGAREGWPASTIIAARFEPLLAATLRDAWAATLTAVPGPRLEAAAAARDEDELLAVIAPTAAAVRVEQAAVGPLVSALLSGADLGGDRLEALGVPVLRGSRAPVVKREPSVDLQAIHAEAVRWARAHAAAMVIGEAELRAAIRRLVVASQAEGVTVRDLARQVRAIIGLDPRRIAALANFELRLKATGVAGEAIIRRTLRYADALRRSRAYAIARTETISALAHGQLAAWQQAARKGLIDKRRMVKQWITTDDDLLCPQCEDLDGETAPLDGDFRGGIAGPPAHPNCRCAFGLVREKGD